jgi:hypothetical protein
MDKLTVFDNLPLDVIKFEIFPYLNYQERINVNQCLPSHDRITRKMNKASIERHERDILIETIKKYLDNHDKPWFTADRQLVNMFLLFSILQKPRYFALIASHPVFRDCVILKIRNLIEQLINLETPVELGLRLKLASELKKLRKKIDTSGPYKPNNSHGAPALSFQ